MNDTITGDSSMQEVLQIFPGAQRALFRKYHIGGCNSCGFRPDETLAGVCERNGDLPVGEVLEKIQQSHDEDALILLEPADLAKRLANDENIRLVDIRSREEFEAVHIKDAVLLTQPLMQEILGSWDNDQRFVISITKVKRGSTPLPIISATACQTSTRFGAASTPGRLRSTPPYAVTRSVK